jgi:phosphosulfolactate phosphohydrolase-like enzyme
MDGNMSLVRRAKAGHSVRNTLYKDLYFCNQEDVNTFVDAQGDKHSPEEQVEFIQLA